MRKAGRSRLDSLISRYAGISKRDVRQLLIHQKIQVDGLPATTMNQLIEPFSAVNVNGQWVQRQQPLYFMLNKPKGVVSATKDTHHKTVLDLIDHPNKSQLHIAGRLDFNTTGLLLLTNDGQWSKNLCLPESNMAKTYRVVLEKPVTEEYVRTFQQGIYFSYEKITTRPAKLNILDDYTVELSLCEGKYHQVKRMFGYFQNTVLELHRLSVGSICLDHQLALGESRSLTELEIQQ